MRVFRFRASGFGGDRRGGVEMRRLEREEHPNPGAVIRKHQNVEFSSQLLGAGPEIFIVAMTKLL